MHRPNRAKEWKAKKQKVPRMIPLTHNEDMLQAEEKAKAEGLAKGKQIGWGEGIAVAITMLIKLGHECSLQKDDAGAVACAVAIQRLQRCKS